MVSPGLDLEVSFSQALQGLGLSPEAARLLWLPCQCCWCWWLLLWVCCVGLAGAQDFSSCSAADRPGIRRSPRHPSALADGLKLLFKEDIIRRADSLLFTLGPVLVVVPVIVSWLIIPFGQNLLISNVGVGIFLWIAFSDSAHRSVDERLRLQQQILVVGRSGAAAQ